MKIFLNNRNYLTWPRGLAELMAEQGHEVILIDNGSTYEPLLDWYSKTEFQIVHLDNLGNQAAWRAGLVTDLNEPFVVSDVDYDLSMIPADWPEVLSEGLIRFPHLSKIGLSWDETTVPPENPAYELDCMGETPEGKRDVWHNIVEGDFHAFPCDTSFAVYRPHWPFRIDGARKCRPYTGIHLPWHLVLEPSKFPGKRSVLMDDEIAYYFEHANHGSTWSYTAIRLQEMVKEYRRRQAA